MVDERTRLLVLGSLPGTKSLTVQQYYGNPQNKFWELIGSVIEVNLRPLAYEQRLATLLEHGVGLWDVIAEAERQGSLDAAIRNETHNGLIELVAQLPMLRAVAFNGGTAAKHGRRQLHPQDDRLVLIDLPSSSPAHTLQVERKAERWCQLRQFIS